MTSLFVNLTLPKIGGFLPFLRDFAENTTASGAGLAMSGKTAIILLIANEIRGLAVVLAFWGVI